MNPTKRATIELHIAVILFGFTAVLGELIKMPFLLLVWWRMVITCISLYFLADISRIKMEMNAITIKELIAYGVLISLHWLAFYGAIQYSSASVALIGLATASFWASLLEPLLQSKRPSQLEMLLGILIIPGMVLIAGSLPTNMWFGLGLGVLSALLSALFSVLNKDVVQKYSSLDISFIELMGALVFLTILLPTTVSHPLFYGWIPTWKDFLYLLVLALVCTTVAYVLSLRALKYLSAFNVTLTVNLEPIYGILLAWIFLKNSQPLSTNFYLGGIMIFAAVLSYPYLKNFLKL